MSPATAPTKPQDTTATPIPDVSLPTLQTLMADLARAYPHAGARVDHAAFLLIARRVERSLGRGWWVGSELTPEAEYLVLPEPGICTCQDHARHGHLSPCKHRLAVELLQRCERLEAETTDPTGENARCADCEDGGRESPEGPRRRCSNCPLMPVPFELTERAFTILATLHTCSRCGRQARRVSSEGRCPSCVTDDLFGPVA
jgi:hypothetical protein